VSFTHRNTSAFRKIMDGVRHAATAHGFWVRTVELAECRRTIAEIVSEWRPLACLLYVPSGIDVLPRRGLGVPVVHINPTAKAQPYSVLHDRAATAQLAARELLRLGWDHHAFVGWHGRADWSDELGAAFAHVLAAYGKDCISFTPRKTNDPPSDEAALGDRLGKLPKACAVFAANDEIASAVIAAATRVGIQVPDELAVLGVDDDVPRCESAPVTISSIAPDYFRAGTAAIEMLASAVDGTARKPQRQTFGDLGVVHRASTRIRRERDAKIAAALEYIRLHVHEGIGAKDVIGWLALKRRTAEARFRRAAGRSILDEIQSVRLEQAELLLGNPGLSIEAVASLVGYVSKNQLARLFKSAHGMTPRAWRKQS
jgi:LacI family transcriptional regulator